MARAEWTAENCKGCAVIMQTREGPFCMVKSSLVGNSPCIVEGPFIRRPQNPTELDQLTKTLSERWAQQRQDFTKVSTDRKVS